MPLTFLDLPGVALDDIFRECDCWTIYRIRRVCRTLRDYIDEKPPEASFRVITVTASVDHVAVTYFNKDLYEIEYRKHPQGTSVTHKDKFFIFDRMNFSDVFLRDFQIMIQHQKSILSNFSLRTKDTAFAEELLKTRKSNKLQVESLEMSLKDEADIQMFLPYFKANVLNSIAIYDLGIKLDEPMEMSEIVMMDHWKNADQAYIAKKLRRISLDHFAHFNRGFVKIESVLAEELVKLKDNFLASPDFRQFCIEFTSLDSEDSFVKGMGPSYDYFGRLKWFYGTPDHASHLSVMYDFHNRQVAFAEYELEKIPLDAKIQY